MNVKIFKTKNEVFTFPESALIVAKFNEETNRVVIEHNLPQPENFPQISFASNEALFTRLFWALASPKTLIIDVSKFTLKND